MASSLDKDASSHLNLLALQSRMKCDPQGYETELLLQLRHFEACLSVFQLQSSANSQSSSTNDHGAAKEVADIAMFLAHMAVFYPNHLSHFPQQILGMLNSNGHSLPSTLRRQLTQALILLRNRQMIELVEILPALMELQTLGDKALRRLASLHIVQDVRRMNLKHRDETKNRALQNIMFQLLQNDDEARAKRALILLCELHKRKLWADERTSNAICAACFHKSSRILKANLSFLLGYENVEDEDEEDSNDDEEKDQEPCVSLSREAIYKAHHKGTVSSRKKKQAKLQRVLRSVKKQQRIKSKAAVGSNSPLEHLQDPQGFAEKLFSRLHVCNERFEVKLMMIKVISRVIGLHRLIVLNFYPFIQKYVQPHQREITHVLAAAVQACHDMVPPDAVESLLRQLVNQFVHDRARPEVIAVGLNTVREICARMPLVMTRDLLHDLALYKKSREKAVSSAARSIIAVFRKLYPSLLEKRDRGKGADLLARPKEFGQNSVSSNVPGIELLAADNTEDSDSEGDGIPSDSGDGDDELEFIEASDGEEDVIKEDEENASSDVESGEGTAGINSESGSSEWDISDDDMESDEDINDQDNSDKGKKNDGKHELKRSSEGNEDLVEPESKRRRVGDDGIVYKGNGECSLRQLKKLVFKEHNGKGKLNGQQVSDDGILSNADFARIKKLQAKQAVQEALGGIGIGRPERRVDPALLEAKIRRRREKDERVATVRAGQEKREAYRPRTAVKQTKTGGLTNRQKEKIKNLPRAAKLAKASKSRNQKKAKRRLTKQFRGRKAWK